jgi:fumarate hydratase class II
LLDSRKAKAIKIASKEVLSGNHDSQFPLDVFQTGSGTSTNMNANEVIANLATKKARIKINANDHVNMSQSSNDVIPTAICISALLDTQRLLLPSLEGLIKVIDKKGIVAEGSSKNWKNSLNGCNANRFFTRIIRMECSIKGC